MVAAPAPGVSGAPPFVRVPPSQAWPDEAALGHPQGAAPVSMGTTRVCVLSTLRLRLSLRAHTLACFPVRDHRFAGLRPSVPPFSPTQAGEQRVSVEGAGMAQGACLAAPSGWYFPTGGTSPVGWRR